MLESVSAAIPSKGVLRGPVVYSESEVSPEPPASIVIFGASGDLTARKLVPSLYDLCRRGYLNPRSAIVGAARRAKTTESFRQEMHEAVKAQSPQFDETHWARFVERLHYQPIEFGTPEHYQDLAQELSRLEAERGLTGDRIFYLATAPRYYAQIVERLDAAGLARPQVEARWARVVFEKPFGYDLDSAHALNESVSRHLDESQVFRIDHYLGKDTVQNIMAFRLGNGIFEPLFNRRYVDHVQITAAEDIGVESGRGGYYDEAGALRDVFQNHLLQLLCLVAMEPPSVIGAKEVRDEKAKVLSAIRALGPVDTWAVRGQYGPGEANGEPVPGYRQEERVAEDSQTETFVAARLQVENWRWAGVPFFLRTGKRMPSKSTRIVVVFKRPPAQYFRTVTCVGDVCSLSPPAPNALVFDIQPNEGVHLYLWVKRPGMNMDVHQVDMSFRYDEAFPGKLPDAYERLLVDVMRGDQTLFARSDEIERAWAIVSPALSHWAGTEASFPNYAAGTWGPGAADRLFPAGSGWLNEGV
ncbi:MAG: glucose-6-phosphate dehydrogenase [candidate division WS1 bacterium]|jgi:glucose-6-phosphate 1-dehydrogenase|nr:glucose-6-phosphate dehydrogenase [candidate division WS1 bacterium]